MIFHRVGASLICIAIFYVLIWFGMFKLTFWHWPRYLILMWIPKKWHRLNVCMRHSRFFIYHYTKALDQAACAGAFGGKSDETISNKAGKMFKDHGWRSPWWVIFTKRLTERWENNHLENAIEPTRPDPDGL